MNKTMRHIVNDNLKASCKCFKISWGAIVFISATKLHHFSNSGTNKPYTLQRSLYNVCLLCIFI